MNRQTTKRNLRAQFARTFRWVPLAVSVLLAALTVRMVTPLLRAADEGTGPNLMSQTQEDADG
jgi:hypothetical protein